VSLSIEGFINGTSWAIFKGAAKISKDWTAETDIERALTRLVEWGTIAAPVYWRKNYSKIKYLDASEAQTTSPSGCLIKIFV